MRAAAALALALLALAGCGGGESAAPVEDLTGLGQLRDDFEAAGGTTRVVLLFAPT